MVVFLRLIAASVMGGCWGSAVGAFIHHEPTRLVVGYSLAALAALMVWVAFWLIELDKRTRTPSSEES